MRTEGRMADTIDEAAEKVLQVLKESVRSRDNVFYFNGWDGLGASAVLRAVAQRLTTTPPAGLEFEKVIHIDCSKWESKRTLQRAVAEQLDLPAEVMEMFDRKDEEDDFRGFAQGSRAELQVDREMYQHIRNRRLLVVFHNGSSEEIDLAKLCGFPLSGYSTSKVLWTFQGRFRVKPRTKVDTAMKTAGTTDVFLSVYRNNKTPRELWSYLVLQEAVEVAAACRVNTGSPGIIIDQPAQVADCFRYMLELCCKGTQSIDYDLDSHSANYWVCDGILHEPQRGERDTSAAAAAGGGGAAAAADDDDDDGLWRAAGALQREMLLDADYHQYLPSPHLLATFVESEPHWTSPTRGFTRIPEGVIPDRDSMFQHCADKLSVLKLSGCTFDFQSPPFLCCDSLRFLWLDRCQGIRTSTDHHNRAGKEDDIRRCFQRLWVLAVRDTDCDQILSARMLDLMTQLRELNVMRAQGWDMGQLQGRLPNIRKLRVRKSSVRCSCSDIDLFSEMDKLELLDFSGSYTSNPSTMMSLFGPAGLSSNSSCCLETVVIRDGCNRIEQISFSGCAGLKNLHLEGGMWALHTLDISGTAVKTLDLSTTAIEYLDELYLLDCHKLCAILWPSKEKMKQEGLSKLCIDTRQSAPATQSTSEEKSKWSTTTATAGVPAAPAAAPHGSRRTSSEFGWHISVRDARLLASLETVYSDSRKAYVEISSPPWPTTAVVAGSKDKGIKSTRSGEQQVLVNLDRQPVPAVYADIVVDHHQQASEGGGETLGFMWMSPCPDVPGLPEESCYIHIQDQDRPRAKLPRGSEETSTITIPRFVANNSKVLHMHDSLSITSTTSNEYGNSVWPNLEWCRIERCPRLDFVFSSADGNFFNYQLRIFWASQLLKSRYISTSDGPRRAFPHLTLLHLDFCPRLIHVHPLSTWEEDLKGSFRLPETLEIVWCGDLREIFPFKGDKPGFKDFPKLKHIHLHELPSLKQICGIRMSAPNLETVKIRGCWSLTRLPDISGSNKIVECDCEKEWWDKLEWGDGSQPNNYKPIHSRYYKKTMLRSSVLR